MEELSDKIIEFAFAHNLTPNDVLCISLRFASIEMAKNVVKRTNTHLSQLTTEQILNDYLEVIEHEKVESSSIV